MALNKTGFHDRRSFEGSLKMILAGIVVSLLVLVVYSWKIGVALFLTHAVAFITIEQISSIPANEPRRFMTYSRRVGARKPTLACLGDSLTHGQCSGSYTPEIPIRVADKLGLEPPDRSKTFRDPVWVVNCGQNALTSHVILNERLNSSLSCYPDYIFIMIGTNDVLSMCRPWLARHIVKTNELPEVPSMKVLEKNIDGILSYIEQSSPMVHVGIATIPPITEDLLSKENKLVRQANEIIKRVAEEYNKVSVVPVFELLEQEIEKNKRRGISIEIGTMIMYPMNAIFHLLPVTWNMMSSMLGHAVLVDGIHLNEAGSDVVADAVADWLVEHGIAKAIAIKR